MIHVHTFSTGLKIFHSIEELKSLDEQVNALQTTLDRAIVNVLIVALGKEHNLTEARIVERASGFQRD